MPADSPCPALFVTGTDTGVGKTTVTAALARYLSGTGLKVGVMKPLETGVEDLSRPGPDARLLCWAARSTDPDESVAPYRFTAAVAPAQAAHATGVRIDPRRIKSQFDLLSAGKDLMLVEGAGGLMVPVEGGYLIADLIKDLDLPVLVITQPRLGTLNHTLLTTFAARSMDLKLVGFLINRMPENPTPAEAEAPHLLASLASADLLGVLPEVDGDDRQQVEALAVQIGLLPTRTWLMQALGLTVAK